MKSHGGFGGALAGVCALTCLAHAGCEPSGEPTEIMAQVYWDLKPEQFDHVAVRVFQMLPDVELTRQCNPPPVVGAAPEECMTLDEHYYVHRWTGTFEVAEGTQPIEVGIAPKGRDAERIAFVEAYALDCEDPDCEDYTVVTRTAARTRFVDGRITNLILWLTRSCIGVECPPEHDCDRGSCRSRDVSVECTTGEAWVDAGAGAPPRCELGDATVPPLMDAGGDDAGGVDAGPTDAGMPDDTGVPDTGTPDAGSGSCPGECSAGEVQRQSCGNCGVQERTCGDDCRWGAWSSCEGEGDCSPGDSSGCSTGFDCSGCSSGCCTAECCQECNDSCTWEWVCGACMDEGGSCEGVYGTTCNGEHGFWEDACAINEARYCLCSDGSWVDCDPCRVI